MQRIDAEFMVYRLEEAGSTLLSLPNAKCFPAQVKSGWPDVVHKVIEAYGYGDVQLRPPVPNAARISRMDEAFQWINGIPLTPAATGSADRWSRHGGATLRRIVMLRCLVSPITERHRYSWRRIAHCLQSDHKAIQRWHDQAIGLLVEHVNKISRQPKKRSCPNAPGCGMNFHMMGTKRDLSEFIPK